MRLCEQIGEFLHFLFHIVYIHASILIHFFILKSTIAI